MEGTKSLARKDAGRGNYDIWTRRKKNRQEEGREKTAFSQLFTLSIASKGCIRDRLKPSLKAEVGRHGQSQPLKRCGGQSRDRCRDESGPSKKVLEKEGGGGASVVFDSAQEGKRQKESSEKNVLEPSPKEDGPRAGGRNIH